MSSGGNNKHGEHYSNIKVVVRSRPMSAAEKAAQTASLVSCDPERRQVCVGMHLASKRPQKTYNFDHVFGQHSTQSDVYSQAVLPLVNEVLEGFNCTVFAYGQTGTGKTHTMEGDVDDAEGMGVIPRAVGTIFSGLESKFGDSADGEYSVKVSFLELYNEELRDLLSETDEKRLRVVEDKSKFNKGVVCHNLEEIIVKTPQAIFPIMRNALAKRQVGETELNHASSRSHCIFTLTVHIKETTPEGDDVLKVGKLNLVDLAGSECIGRSGATNKRAREAGNINQSLLTLGRVISTLVEKAPHIPYRDSKLTRLLQESLGGRAKTCIIATVAPSVQCLDETIGTLDYASRAKAIKNKPEENVRMNKRVLLKEYDFEIERLRQELGAARSKNGVFLPEEHYSELMTTVESQKTEVAELEAALELRMKELKEIQTIFEQTTEELNGTKEELQGTKVQLDNTQHALGVTTEERDAQRRLKNQAKTLMHAHASTEVTLQVRTRELHGVLDGAVKDVSQLHSKIDRKDRVEQTNMSRSESLVKRAEEMLQNVANKSASFRSEQIKRANETAAQVQLGRESTNNALENVQQQLQQVIVAAREGMNAAACVSIEQEDDIKTGFGDMKAGSETRMTDILATLVNSMQQVGTSVERLSSELTVHQKKLKTWSGDAENRVEGMKVAALEFVSTHQEELQSVKAGLNELDSTHTDQLAHLRNNMSTYCEQEKVRRKGAAAKAMQQMSSVIEQMQAEYEESLQVFTASHTDAADKWDQQRRIGRDVVSTRLDTATQQTIDWQNQAVLLSQQASEALSAQAREASQQCTNMVGSTADASKCVQDTTKEVETNVNGQVKALKDSADQCEHKLLERSAAAAVKVSSVLSACENAATEGSESAMQVGESIEHVEELRNSCQREDSEAVEDVYQDVDAFTHEMRSSLRVYLSQELVRDAATGQTPTRKQYSFSRTIHATSPHKRVLDRFEQEAESLNLTQDDDDDDSDLYQDRHMAQATVEQQEGTEVEHGEAVGIFGGVSPMSPSPRRSLVHELSDIDESPEKQASSTAATTPPAKAVAMTPGSFLKRLTGSTDSGDDEENYNESNQDEYEDGQIRSKSRSALQAIEACNLDNVITSPSENDTGVGKARSSSECEKAVDKQTPPPGASSDDNESSGCEQADGDMDVDVDVVTSDEVMKMKVAQLRKELSTRSASQVGNKATLQSRLLVLLDDE